jgi:hypothetical protein
MSAESSGNWLVACMTPSVVGALKLVLGCKVLLLLV